MSARLPPPALPAWLERQLPFRRSRVLVDGLGVHLMEQGSGRAVLMVHGNPSWGYLWRKVAARLVGDDLHLVMPDLVGLGYSDHPRDPGFHTLPRHAEILGGLIDTLELDEVILVIQDWGGPIGLLGLDRSRARLAGLVVMNTVVGPPRPGFRPTAFHRLANAPLLGPLLFRGLGVPQVALGLAQGDRRSISGEVARAYREPLRGLARNVAPLALARMVPDSLSHPTVAPLQRCQDAVTAFSGPTAIVWGDRDPVLGRVRTHLERLLPHARVTRTDAGHFLQEEVPDEIADAIRWVARQIA